MTIINNHHKLLLKKKKKFLNQNLKMNMLKIRFLSRNKKMNQLKKRSLNQNLQIILLKRKKWLKKLRIYLGVLLLVRKFLQYLKVVQIFHHFPILRQCWKGLKEKRKLLQFKIRYNGSFKFNLRNLQIRESIQKYSKFHIKILLILKIFAKDLK